MRLATLNTWACAVTGPHACRLESLAAELPGHVIVAGDMDADEASDSMRFWTAAMSSRT